MGVTLCVIRGCFSTLQQDVTLPSLSNLALEYEIRKGQENQEAFQFMGKYQ
jgi:hypothetical protein